MVCRGGAVIDFVRRWTEEVGFLLLRLLFPLLAVVVAGIEAEWILVLWVDPGELRFFGSPCEVGGPLGSRMDLLGCPFFSAVAVRGCFLWLLVLCSGASGYVESGGFGDKSLGPTADALFSRISNVWGPPVDLHQ